MEGEKRIVCASGAAVDAAAILAALYLADIPGRANTTRGAKMTVISWAMASAVSGLLLSSWILLVELAVLAFLHRKEPFALRRFPTDNHDYLLPFTFRLGFITAAVLFALHFAGIIHLSI